VIDVGVGIESEDKNLLNAELKHIVEGTFQNKSGSGKVGMIMNYQKYFYHNIYVYIYKYRDLIRN